MYKQLLQHEVEAKLQLKENHGNRSCSICFKEIQGLGKDAKPIKPNTRCCDDCHKMIVLPARLKSYKDY